MCFLVTAWNINCDQLNKDFIYIKLCRRPTTSPLFSSVFGQVGCFRELVMHATSVAYVLVSKVPGKTGEAENLVRLLQLYSGTI